MLFFKFLLGVSLISIIVNDCAGMPRFRGFSGLNDGTVVKVSFGNSEDSIVEARNPYDIMTGGRYSRRSSNLGYDRGLPALRSRAAAAFSNAPRFYGLRTPAFRGNGPQLAHAKYFGWNSSKRSVRPEFTG